eukprot:PhF_6_TR37553/c0_g1_i1/m.55628
MLFTPNSINIEPPGQEDSSLNSSNRPTHRRTRVVSVCDNNNTTTAPFITLPSFPPTPQSTFSINAKPPPLALLDPDALNAPFDGNPSMASPMGNAFVNVDMTSPSVRSTRSQDKETREIEVMVTRCIIHSKDLPRTCHSLVYINNKRMMAFGGKDEEGRFTSTMAVYQLSKNEWRISEPKASFYIAPRANHSAAVLRNRMYVYGGHNDMMALDEFLVCDVDSLTWSPVVTETQNSPKSRFGHCSAACPLTLRVFIIGGMHVEEIEESIFEFNVKRNSWSRIRGPPGTYLNQVSRTFCAVNQKNLYVLGLLGQYSSLTVHVLNIEERSWTQVITSGIPAPYLRVQGMLLAPPVFYPTRNQWMFYLSVDANEFDEMNYGSVNESKVTTNPRGRKHTMKSVSVSRKSVLSTISAV